MHYFLFAVLSFWKIPKDEINFSMQKYPIYVHHHHSFIYSFILEQYEPIFIFVKIKIELSIYILFVWHVVDWFEYPLH